MKLKLMIGGSEVAPVSGPPLQVDIKSPEIDEEIEKVMAEEMQRAHGFISDSARDMIRTIARRSYKLGASAIMHFNCEPGVLERMGITVLEKKS